MGTIDRKAAEGKQMLRQKTTRSLADFRGHGYEKGRPKVVQMLWVATSEVVVQSLWCPPALRVWILRAFGAEIGERVLIRNGVRIHWPWKLKIGSDVWIGVDAWLLNLEDIEIGSNVCISQEAMLCTGSHQMRSPSFEFDNAPIVVNDGAWIAARATILRGVTIGTDAVVGAAALVTRSIADGSIALAPRASISDGPSQ